MTTTRVTTPDGSNPYQPPRHPTGPLGGFAGDASGIDEYEGELVARLGKVMRSVGTLHFLMVVLSLLLAIAVALVLRNAATTIEGRRLINPKAVYAFAAVVGAISIGIGIASGLLLQQGGSALESWQKGQHLMRGFGRLRAWLVMSVVLAAFSTALVLMLVVWVGIAAAT